MRRAIYVIIGLGLTVAVSGQDTPVGGLDSRLRAQPGLNEFRYVPLLWRGAKRSDFPSIPTARPTATATATPTPTATVASPTPTAIPVTATPTTLPSRIHGRIVADGEPLPAGFGSSPGGPQIELRRRQGVGGKWTRIANTVTRDGGSFDFESPPALQPGEAYQVWWDVDPNLFIESWLIRWTSREITALEPDDEVDVGEFDVTNLEVTKPENFWWNTLPLTFSWRTRANSSEGYRLALVRRCGYNSNDLDRDDAYVGENLGKRGSFRLESLPPGFEYDKRYCWFVIADGGVNGTGYPLHYRHITFCSDPRVNCPP